MKNIAVALLILVASPLAVSAHEGHGHGGDTHARHQHCATFAERSEVAVPDFTQTRWRSVKTAALGSFTYVFYHDTTLPGIPIAATTATGTNPITGISATRVTWRMGSTIWTVSSEEERVCEKSVYGTDGKKYALEEYMEKIERAAQKEPQQ